MEKINIQAQCFITKTRIETSTFSKIAFVFKGMNPLVIDLDKSKTTWKAKNVKNDFLDLKVPIYDMDCEFYDKGRFLFTCTAYRKIRLYDTSVNNSQPLLDIESSESSPFNLMQINSKCLYVANHSGSIFKWRITQNENDKFNLIIAGKFNCSRATLKCFNLVKDEENDEIVIASSGYNRYFCLHEESCKTLRRKIFTGLKSTCFHVPKSIVCPELEEEDVQKEVTLKEKYKGANQSKTLNLGLYGQPEISDWQSESSLNSKKVKTT